MRLPTACAPPAPKPPMTAAAPTELPTKPVSAPAAAPAPAVVITDPATAASAGAANPPETSHICYVCFKLDKPQLDSHITLSIGCQRFPEHLKRAECPSASH